MITSQYRIETGSNDINPHKWLISLVSPFEKSDFKDESSGSVNSKQQSSIWVDKPSNNPRC